MIEVLKNSTGYIYAYIEWETVDYFGNSADSSKYIFVQNIWIHEDWERTGAIRELIKDVAKSKFSRNAEWIYWRRSKYNNRVSKLYHRSQFLKEKENVKAI